MPSVIFTTMARILFWVMLAASLLIMLRGHDQPGGGFVGGLVAAMAIGLVALAEGAATARARLPLHPVSIAGLGVLFAIIGGLPGLFSAGTFLDHQWVVLLGGDLKLGTTLIFDFGVYLVVLGGVVALILRLYEVDA